MHKLKTFKYKTNPTTSENGILNKITKSYSSVSAKLIKKSPKRRNSSPTKPSIAGSYNMTVSDDHRIEIGEPILISKTTIDTDRLDNSGCSDQSKVIPHQISTSNRTSSESENEIYVDAVSSIQSERDLKFQSLPSPEQQSTTNENQLSVADLTAADSYEVPRRRKHSEHSTPLRKNKSKSAQNLHKSELRVFLQKAPSLELNLKLTTANLQNCFDLPRKPNEKNVSDIAKTDTIPQHALSTSEPNTPFNPEQLPETSCQSKSSESILDREGSVPKSVAFSSVTGNTSNGSHNSVALSSSVEDFNLKSVSCQSLDAKNLFLSIEELNEITRQINDCEDWHGEIDLEYCEHRDNLKPSERRITLLKNKNTRLISLHHNKDRINNAWSGLKNWFGEESEKFKEVVQKHAGLQRVGAARQPDEIYTKSPVAEVKRSHSQITSSAEPTTSYTSSTLSLARSIMSGQTLVGDDENEIEESKATSIYGTYRDISPFSKKPKLTEKWEGQNGFEELRRYIKQGGDFGKDLVTILQERADAEQFYAKSLSKMASKLNKACREIPGTIADAWRGVATEMESRSEVHRQFSNSLVEDIVKPLKVILDNHHKTRKSVETNVDKSARILSDWRISEAKSKKVSHTAARENEKLQDAMLDVRIQKSPSIGLLQHGGNKGNSEKEIKNAEKDCAKLDNKRRKAEEAVKRADVEYYTLCIRAERARVDWEMSVLRGSSVLQNLENQRLGNMKSFANSYLRITSDMNPIIEQVVRRLEPQVEACNPQKDLTVVKNIRRASEGPSEQLLPDFYCEHTTLAMNRERRKHALIKLLQLVKTDLERERRSRNSLKGLSQTLNTQDNQSITDKLYHIRSMLTYLEGARFKLHSALLELDHKPRSTHPLAPHIQVTRDRTGLQQSILKVPLWLKTTDKLNDSRENEYEIESQANGSCLDIKNEVLIKQYDKNFGRSKSSSELLINNQNIYGNDKSQTLPAKDPDTDSPEFDRGIADGGSNQPDSDFDEFSSQDEEDESSTTRKDKIDGTMSNGNFEQQLADNKPVVISKCKALYSYSPKLYDELELTPGDIIEVHIKQEDGWWLGALKNRIGIFPATYVEEFI